MQGNQNNGSLDQAVLIGHPPGLNNRHSPGRFSGDDSDEFAPAGDKMKSL